jgi:hypothetical protein
MSKKLTVGDIVNLEPLKMDSILSEVKFPEQGVVWDMCIKKISALPVDVGIDIEKSAKIMQDVGEDWENSDYPKDPFYVYISKRISANLTDILIFKDPSCPKQ